MPDRGTWKRIGSGGTPPLQNVRIESSRKAAIMAAMTGSLGGVVAGISTVVGTLAGVIGYRESSIYYRTYLYEDTACVSFACDIKETRVWYAKDDQGRLRYGGETVKIHYGY